MAEHATSLPLDHLRTGLFRWWHVVLAGAVLIGGAILEGYWSLRWDTENAELSLNPLAQAVEQTPLNIGSWSADEPMTPDPRVVEISGARAFLGVTYRDQLQGDAVTVYLLGGWSRDISVHTPDACYPGAGFVMDTDPQPFTLTYSGSLSTVANGDFLSGAREAEFMTAVFTKTEPTGVTRVRVFWTWNDGRGWRAPQFPRWTYGGRRPLVKLYLVAEAPLGQLPHDSPALRLAEQLLPVLDSRLEQAFFGNRAASSYRNPTPVRQ